jgi:hypothetical protein
MAVCHSVCGKKQIKIIDLFCCKTYASMKSLPVAGSVIFTEKKSA